ncbi:peroxiredoxin [Myxococcota bacterium]|nr:peroxiredoxin [Myxococcota bacterium]
MITTGTQAPNFTLLNGKREPVSLEGMKGKKVVLAFFPAAFTGVCTKEMCTFRDSMAQLNGLDAEVLGISVDAPFSNAAFAEKHSLNFPLLSDYAREATNAYGIAINDFAGMKGYTASKRAVYVLDREGVVQYAWEGPNPGVEPDYAAVKSAVEGLK